MMSSSNTKLIVGSFLAATCAILCLALSAQAQYNTYNSDSNSDSEGGQILSNAELGKLVRNSAKAGRDSNFRNYNQQQQLAATRNLYNKQQPLQYAPSQYNRRQFGASDSLSGYNPLGTAASNGASNANNDDDDDNEGGNMGPNFGANFDNNDNDGDAQADGKPMNLNQAASGYPGQGDYNEGAGFNFGGAGGYGPSADGSEFGPSEGYGSEGRQAKSASSLMGSRNFGGDEDAGAPRYGPNSAVNSGDRDGDDEGRSNYASETSNDNDNDDE